MFLHGGLIMKKITLLLGIILVLSVSCTKEPSEQPEEPSNEPTKYISKILIPDNDSALHVMETYTWDSAHRLININSALRVYFRDVTFSYDSLGRISRMDVDAKEIFDGNYYLFYWKNEHDLDSVEVYKMRWSDGSIFLSDRYYYFYDETGKCVDVLLKFLSSESLYAVEWRNENILSIENIYAATTTFFINSALYDNMLSPWSECPKILIFHFYGALYNISKNNPLGWGEISYDYEYNQFGYPVKQYRTENGLRELRYVFEYE